MAGFRALFCWPARSVATGHRRCGEAARKEPLPPGTLPGKKLAAQRTVGLSSWVAACESSRSTMELLPVANYRRNSSKILCRPDGKRLYSRGNSVIPEETTLITCHNCCRHELKSIPERVNCSGNFAIAAAGSDQSRYPIRPDHPLALKITAIARNTVASRLCSMRARVFGRHYSMMRCFVL